jgi:putative protease
MPYDLVVDGEVRDLGEVKYLLSPKDLAGYKAVPGLAEAGVVSLKVEGRYKGPAYVTSVVEGYRRWLDAVGRGPTPADEARMAADLDRMALAYSRGFSDGFLGGSDHQTLVEGRFPKHRGVFLGRVRRVDGDAVTVALGEEAQPSTGGRAIDGDAPVRGAAVDARPPAVAGRRSGGASVRHADPGAQPSPVEVRAGMGVVFDAGRPESQEQGGPVFAVSQGRGEVVLRFGRPGPDLRRVEAGQRVWITGDPALAREAEKQRAPEGRIPVALRVSGREGGPLVVEARLGRRVVATSEERLAPARGAGLDEALIREKIGAFGGTPFRLESLDAGGLAPGLHLPVSALKAVRRALVAALEDALNSRERVVAANPVLPGLLAHSIAADPGPPQLVPLCRTDEQLEAAIAAGLPEVELDWMELVGLRRAVERARAAGLRVVIATVRVQKPGEEGYDRRIAQLEPDGVLVRHWGALIHFLEHPDERRPVLHGDFSLNVTNSLTANHLLARGLSTVTAAHDLDREQVLALLAATPAGRVAVTAHHHIPTFHTEHCVYAHLLSKGRDFRTCGRPCERHAVGLRDHTGHVHPVVVDVGCRNTVFNAAAQSAAGLVPRLVEAGVRRLRVELVRESRAEAEAVLAAYADLLAGRVDAAGLRRRVGVHEQFGLTAGTMQVLG